MNKKEATIKCLDIFDSLRPSDVSDYEWLKAKVAFGIISLSGNMVDEYLLNIAQGVTHEYILETVKLELSDYTPKIKQWIIEQMR